MVTNEVDFAGILDDGRDSGEPFILGQLGGGHTRDEPCGTRHRRDHYLATREKRGARDEGWGGSSGARKRGCGNERHGDESR